ncbi:MAG: integrase arm-type DNA-binding domain-containing protein [Nevskia sp.]|nr:integrase arm-type DNA-binding domain-containing protein [Nevskia sp.]
MSLTDTKIRNAKPKEKPYKLMDGLGLFLFVSPNGSKLWRYRFWLHGKEGLYSIGDYPMVSLAQAREARDKARALVKQGVHPVRQRQEVHLRQANEANNTFEAVAREWMDHKSVKWSEVRHKRVKRTLEKEVFPEIGALPIKEISSARLLPLIRNIAKRPKRPAPVTALLVQELCGSVFRYSILTLRAENDPTYALRGVVERPRIKHKTPLDKKDIPVLVGKLANYGGSPVTVAALRLLLLTFVRPGEVRRAQWDQIDLDAAEWRIPAPIMKMRDTHIVPLSRQAVGVIRELHRLTGDRDYLFPNIRRPKSFMASTTLNQALANIGFRGKFSAHGFRATASTLMNEMDFDEDLIERQLDHQERNATRASYNQAKHLAKRKAMMQEWADYLDSLIRGADKVVSIRSKKAA